MRKQPDPASCPKLQPWAYQPDQLDHQHDRVARALINDPTRNRFDRKQKVASLSMIFHWFEKDFTDAAGSVGELFWVMKTGFKEPE